MVVKNFQMLLTLLINVHSNGALQKKGMEIAILLLMATENSTSSLFG
jgi:hypothetical protein